MELYRLRQGSTPLLISMPHAGSYLPSDIAARLAPAARPTPDTDWHVDRLYGFAAKLGAGLLAATHSRYVIDLNRPPDGRSLYPGADNTELCPTTTFDGEPIYADGRAPDPNDVAARLKLYWRPYHERLADELARIRERHGIALLWEGHSIRSRVPRFFDGRLPDFNFGTGGGTGGGATCAPELAQRIVAVLDQSNEFSAVLNGRFTGGYITRRFGDPANHIHAIQLELSQITYMDEAPPYDYRPDRAGRVQNILERLLTIATDWVGRF